MYYVIGTKDELKEHSIIEGGGFLRKTKILPKRFAQFRRSSGLFIELLSQLCDLLVEFGIVGCA